MVRDVSTETQRIIRDNWLRVQEEVARACQAAGRDPAEVTIVGVAKYVGPELTAQLVTAGCPLIGENRPQALWDKHAWFVAQGPQRVPMPQWHLIGHLQRNKVRRTLPLVSLIQSVDSLRLIEELGLEADRQQSAVRLLLDVNVTRDASKTGLAANQLSQAAEAILERPRLQLCGLMAMSTLEADAATVHQEFAQVRQLRDQLLARYPSLGALAELSMGMSGDFREAIAEGSTCVRIGSHLWTSVV